jgi:hypothetical protein
MRLATFRHVSLPQGMLMAVIGELAIDDVSPNLGNTTKIIVGAWGPGEPPCGHA